MKKFIFLLLIAFCFTACSGIKTYSDYDKNTDFNTYSSFSFYKDMQTGLSTLDKKRFQYAVTATLQAADYSLSEKADFKINFYADFYEHYDRSTIGVSFGGTGSHVGGGVSGKIPVSNRKQTLSLTIEFIDAQTNQLFWQGVVETEFRTDLLPEERRNYFKELAEKVLDDYPPEK